MAFDLIRHEESAMGYPGDGMEPQNPINFRRILQVLREKIWLLLVIATVGGVAAWYVAERQPAKYKSRVVLQVEQEEQKFLNMEEVSRQDLRATELLNTIVQNIKNTSVMLRVVRNNHLAEDPDFRPGKTNRPPDLALAHALGGMVTAKLRTETRLIDITVTHPKAAMAQKLANAVAQEFISQLQEQRFGTTRAANDLLYQEATKLKDKLEVSERRVQSYKETNQTVSIEDRKTILTEKLKELSAKCTAAKADRLAVESDLKQMQNLTQKPEALLVLPEVTGNQSIADVRRKVIEQEAVVATLSQRYKPKFPKMVQAQRQLDDLRASMNALVMNVPKSLQATHAGALAREKTLENAFKEAQQEAIALDQKAIGYDTLVREAQSDRALYDSVLKRMKEVDLSKGFDRSTISIVELGELPMMPIKIPADLVGGASFLLLFLGGLGLFYLIRAANSSIQTVDDAENLLGLPVWAAIPKAPRGRKRHSHIVVEDPASICSEGFRTLRTSARIATQSTAGNIHAFTSADPAEGKTFCCLNHALCQAQQGRATLLIDLDLRKPSLGESFSLPADTPGVTDYLTGKRPLADCIQHTKYDNLWIMPAGALVTNPAEELAKDSIVRMLQEISRDYEQIVIDTPPILAVSDAFLILPLVDTICLVVRTGKTPRRIINRALELMARANVPPSGIVLNFMPRQNGHGYYYYGADRRYGKDGIYRSEPKLLTNAE